VSADIKSQTREELDARFKTWSQPAYRLSQLLQWLYVHRVTEWDAMTNLPKTLRELLRQNFSLQPLELVRQRGSRDATRKFLWRLADRSLIESVLLPANPSLYGEPADRHTLCVSTQVGCAYGCKFCASGLDGWKRNLRVEEIVEQVVAVERWNAARPGEAPHSTAGDPLSQEFIAAPLATIADETGPARAVGRVASPGAAAPLATIADESGLDKDAFQHGRDSPQTRQEADSDATGLVPTVESGATVPGGAARLINNLVIMGMGEPLANYDNLLKALGILNAAWGGGIGARKITISTSGLAPQIRKLAGEPLQFRLAISLHGATDETRNQLMPVNRKYPLRELMAACEYYQAKRGGMITFEYILIAGVNDAIAETKSLAQLARRLHAKVNLIPYNQVEGLDWARPDEARQEAFLAALEKLKVSATLRREKGHDIDAACGQLRLQTERELAPVKTGEA
jgi:adenine C2-methylase RlmN of 23S rRNA A2503 and tRNA A37